MEMALQQKSINNNVEVKTVDLNSLNRTAMLTHDPFEMRFERFFSTIRIGAFKDDIVVG